MPAVSDAIPRWWAYNKELSFIIRESHYSWSWKSQIPAPYTLAFTKPSRRYDDTLSFSLIQVYIIGTVSPALLTGSRGYWGPGWYVQLGRSNAVPVQTCHKRAPNQEWVPIWCSKVRMEHEQGKFVPVRCLQAARQMVMSAKGTEVNYSSSMQLCSVQVVH